MIWRTLLLTLAPLYRFVPRPVWRVIKRMAGHGQPAIGGYWQTRQAMNYYRAVVGSARRIAPQARSVIDVGAKDTDVIGMLDWIPDKTALDIDIEPRPGVRTIRTDFMAWESDRGYDLALCLQVLEHVADPVRFLARLRVLDCPVIVSVPYKWPCGAVPSHIHDPIDRAKFLRWCSLVWSTTPALSIVWDGWDRRLIATIGGRP